MFLTIFRRFPTTFRRFLKIFQNCSEGKTNVSEHFTDIFRRLPRITEDFQPMMPVSMMFSKYFLRDYATIGMVIISLAMATPTSSHVKDKNSIFTACDKDIIFSKRKNPGISQVIQAKFVVRQFTFEIT